MPEPLVQAVDAFARERALDRADVLRQAAAAFVLNAGGASSEVTP
jgi:hypothetical protein